MARQRDGFQFLIMATLLTIVVWFIPHAWVVIYPFRLFVTFIHEGGHALFTVLTGGTVKGLQIHLDASGETYSLGGIPLVIASAGYLASTVYGACLLVICREGRNAKAALSLTAVFIMALTIFYAKGPLSATAGIGMAIGLVAVALALRERAAHFFTSFLAIQCCLNALFDLKTLFIISTSSGGGSDAANMAQMTGIPAIFWALLWLVVSLLCLWAGLRTYGNPYAKASGMAVKTITRRRREYVNS